MNKDNTLTALLALLSSMVMLSAGETNLQHFTFQQFEKELWNLHSQKFKSSVSAQDLTILRLRAEGSVLPKDSWSAILQLWVLGEHDFVQLLWWRKEDSQTRAFIVSLEWCMVTVPAKNSQEWPMGISCYEADAIRFEPIERSLRLQETDFVREHYSALAHHLGVILSASGIELSKRYEGFSKASGQRPISGKTNSPGATKK